MPASSLGPNSLCGTLHAHHVANAAQAALPPLVGFVEDPTSSTAGGFSRSFDRRSRQFAVFRGLSCERLARRLAALISLALCEMGVSETYPRPQPASVDVVEPHQPIVDGSCLRGLVRLSRQVMLFCTLGPLAPGTPTLASSSSQSRCHPEQPRKLALTHKKFAA